MKLSGNHPNKGYVHIDEFFVKGREEGKIETSYNTKKKKVVCAMELINDGKVKRMYSMKTDNYTAKELKKLFNKHISNRVTVSIDKWKGYRPLMEQYNTTQINY